MGYAAIRKNMSEDWLKAPGMKIKSGIKVSGNLPLSLQLHGYPEWGIF